MMTRSTPSPSKAPRWRVCPSCRPARPPAEKTPSVGLPPGGVRHGRARLVGSKGARPGVERDGWRLSPLLSQPRTRSSLPLHGHAPITTTATLPARGSTLLLPPQFPPTPFRGRPLVLAAATTPLPPLHTPARPSPHTSPAAARPARREPFPPLPTPWRLLTVYLAGPAGAIAMATASATAVVAVAAAAAAAAAAVVAVAEAEVAATYVNALAARRVATAVVAVAEAEVAATLAARRVATAVVSVAEAEVAATLAAQRVATAAAAAVTAAAVAGAVAAAGAAPVGVFLEGPRARARSRRASMERVGGVAGPQACGGACSFRPRE
ncbi:hypothetical protein I4F81_001919 [Pyropia yezoensis]|uniref:Uncharacterized protein n=1 Tax=Pyropia yezoensis TaxID=2788 RepID=A0ACC3BN44_PYRYE|nr:hypothetical protein I4F81_001919 [Neopyropia yezoensis]